MSEFVSELKAAWMGNRRRRLYQATRGFMTPKKRQTLEDEFDRQLAKRDAEVAAKAYERAILDVGLNPDLANQLLDTNPYRKAVQS